MKISVLSTSLLVLALSAGGTARATDYYVSTTGSDSNAGTMTAPWATLQKGASTAAAGDTVWIRGGHLHHHHARHQRRRHQLHEERDVGRQPDQVLGLPRRASRSSTSRTWSYRRPATRMGFVGHRQLPALQGARDPQRPDEHLLQQRRVGDQRRLRHLRAARHAPQQRQRDLHRQQDRRWPPGSQLRRARQLRRDLDPGPGPECRRLRRPLSDGRRHHDHPRLPRLVELRRRLRPHQPGGSGHRRELLGHRQRLRRRTAPSIPTSGNGNGFKMGSSRTGVRHLVQNNVAWKNKASGFYANHSTGGNTWYNNTSFQNGTQVQHAGQQLRFVRQRDGDHHSDGSAGAHHAEQHRLSRTRTATWTASTPCSTPGI